MSINQWFQPGTKCGKNVCPKKNGMNSKITRGKTWELQTRAKEALKHVFYI
jgi:hypothetical protein